MSIEAGRPARGAAARVGAPQRGTPPGPGPRSRWVAWIWVAVLALGTANAIRHAWVSDDIYITFRYCDNVLAGHGPVYNPGERSEGYTHLLWFLLLTLGRGASIDPQILGKYLGIPAFIGCLVMLVRLSARLFPGRGGLYGIPVAALGWALHEDAQSFASGGLETPLFILLLLIGFEFLCLSRHPRRWQLAAWAYGTSCLVRPEGLLYSGLAAVYIVWRSRRVGTPLRDFGCVWLLLVVPLFAFRMLYYGYPFPNPYYAKSGSLAYWEQGLRYLRIYFGSYFILILPAVAAWPLARALRRDAGPAMRDAAHATRNAGPAMQDAGNAMRNDGQAMRDAAPPLLLAYLSSALTILYVTRVGGDFMFARFFLPITVYLLLLLEYLVQHFERRAWRIAATVGVVGLVLVGAALKHRHLGHKQKYFDIVDEPQFYPDARMQEIREKSRPLRACLEGTNAVLMVQGGQASLAYYAHFPVAIERYGLTDVHIAHSPITQRGRPGHEKSATADYIYSRGVHFRIHYQPLHSAYQFALFALPGVAGEIIIYDRPLMEHLKSCAGAQFLDFPLYLERQYIPNVLPNLQPRRLIADFNEFKRFYFDHNPDPERLQDRLRAALAARGVTEIPLEPIAPESFPDTGRPTATN